jgi:hypothetical protein
MSFDGMQEGIIPNDLEQFAQLVAVPLQGTKMSTPPRHRPRKVAPAIAPPRCSKRLAKKAVHRTPVVAAVQNLLMRKLGLLPHEEMRTEDFDKYMQLFFGGLSKEQTRIICELFMDYTPAPEAGELVVEEV